VVYSAKERKRKLSRGRHCEPREKEKRDSIRERPVSADKYPFRDGWGWIGVCRKHLEGIVWGGGFFFRLTGKAKGVPCATRFSRPFVEKNGSIDSRRHRRCLRREMGGNRLFWPAIQKQRGNRRKRTQERRLLAKARKDQKKKVWAGGISASWWEKSPKRKGEKPFGGKWKRGFSTSWIVNRKHLGRLARDPKKRLVALP